MHSTLTSGRASSKPDDEISHGTAQGESLPRARLIWIAAGRANHEAALEAVAHESPLLATVLQSRHRSGNVLSAGLEWIRWPQGREQLRALPPVRGQLEEMFVRREQTLLARCVAVDAKAVDDGRVRALPDGRGPRELRTQAMSVRRVLSSWGVNAVKREAIFDYWRASATKLEVPLELCNSSARAAAIGLADAFEELVGSADSASTQVGRVMVTFAGADRHSQEIWDQDGPRTVLKHLVDHAPWWPLLIHPTHAFVFPASCVRHGGTRYRADGEVALDFAAEPLQRFIARSLVQASGVLRELGLPSEGDQNLEAKLLEPYRAFARAQLATTTETKPLRDWPPIEEIGPLQWKAKFEAPMA